MKSRSGRERDVLGGRTERIAYEAISGEEVRFRSLELERSDDEEGIDPSWFDRPAPDRSTDRMLAVPDPDADSEPEPEPLPLPPPPPLTLAPDAHDLAAYDLIEVRSEESGPRLISGPAPDLAFVARGWHEPSTVVAGEIELDLVETQKVAPVPLEPEDTPDGTLPLWGHAGERSFEARPGIEETLPPADRDRTDRVDAIEELEPLEALDGDELEEATVLERGITFAEGTGESYVGRSLWRGLVAVFVGARGGAGTTTVAVNVAVRLAAGGRRVCLVDLDLAFGGVPGVLDLIEPARTAPAELARIAADLQPDDLARHLARHASGLRVLARVPERDGAAAAGGDPNRLPQELDRLLAFLTASFDFVVVDGGAGLGAGAHRALAVADQVFLVASQEAPTLRRAARVLAYCRDLGLSREKLRLVLNRYGRRGANLELVERTIGMPVLATVANDYRTALGALDAGIPIVSTAARRRIGRDLTHLADILGRQPAPMALPLSG
jgi:MinD-like ATPase involved in chromosome partitioning or flagellar assembly